MFGFYLVVLFDEVGYFENPRSFGVSHTGFLKLKVFVQESGLNGEKGNFFTSPLYLVVINEGPWATEWEFGFGHGPIIRAGGVR